MQPDSHNHSFLPFKQTKTAAEIYFTDLETILFVPIKGLQRVTKYLHRSLIYSLIRLVDQTTANVLTTYEQIFLQGFCKTRSKIQPY